MATEKIPLTKPKYSDKKKILRQRIDKGMTLQEIADNNGITKQSVCSLLQRIKNKDVIKAYTDKRSDIYALIESDILESIDADDIKKASLLQRITSAGILKTHERLERGQSTSNVSVHSQLIESISVRKPPVKCDSSAKAGLELDSQAVDITSNDNKA